MTILNKLWKDESKPADVKISCQYVLKLREKLEETIKLAQEELKKNMVRYKKKYNKKTKEFLMKA